MTRFEMNDYLARVEQAVRDSLRGAQVIALVEWEVDDHRENYWERIYYVAWQRVDQCGTHRVNINSRGESMCSIGHYDMNYADAVRDMLLRSGKVNLGSAV
jgi:hypothetical protein